MMNLQELQTIAGQRLPIKVFLLNNGGYVSVFQTQAAFFDGAEVGGGPRSGVDFPDFAAVGRAFGFTVLCAGTEAELGPAIAQALAADGPVICELVIDGTVPFAPKLGARQHPDGRITSPALEDLSPFLPRDELRATMLIALEDDE
jgi:acetolactate synthase-1/2/3 large subunit